MTSILRNTALGLSLAACAIGASAADVSMPDPNYATATAAMNVIKALAEDELGLTVDTVTTTAVPVIWEAMARGKGEVDVWPDTWLPNQKGLVDKYVHKDGTVKLAARHYNAAQGYCATKVTAEKYGVTSVFDLANPENAKLFDTDGNGKGEIWIGAPGWQSTNIEKVRARDYGFAEFFDLQATDEAVSNAKLDRAAKAGKPWVGYCYSPHQNFARYDLVFLDEPKHQAAKFVMVQPNVDPDWYEKSHVASAYADTTVHVAYSATLPARQPQLVEMLERIEFDPAAISGWAFEIIVNKRAPAEVARAWIAANPDVVRKWLGR